MSGIDGTFGNTPAAITLARLVAADSDNQFRKVGKMLSSFNRTLNELNKIDTTIRIGLGKLVFENYKKSANSYSDEYRTYLSNVITGRYRNWLRINNANTPRKTRIINEL